MINRSPNYDQFSVLSHQICSFKVIPGSSSVMQLPDPAISNPAMSANNFDEDDHHAGKVAKQSGEIVAIQEEEGSVKREGSHGSTTGNQSSDLIISDHHHQQQQLGPPQPEMSHDKSNTNDIFQKGTDACAVSTDNGHGVRLLKSINSDTIGEQPHVTMHEVDIDDDGVEEDEVITSAEQGVRLEFATSSSSSSGFRHDRLVSTHLKLDSSCMSKDGARSSTIPVHEHVLYSAHSPQNQAQLMYEFRPRNPKRSRHNLSDIHDNLHSSTMAITQKDMPMVGQESDSQVENSASQQLCPPAPNPILVSGPARGSLAENEPNRMGSIPSKKTKGINWKEKLMATGRPVCSECGKEFHSWKAMFGHMRCHPERQWRGIQPPPHSHMIYHNSTTASPIPKVKNPRQPGLNIALIRRKKKAVSLDRFRHCHGMLSASVDRISSTGNGTDRSGDDPARNLVQLDGAGIPSASLDPRPHPHHHAKELSGHVRLQWDSKDPPVLLEEEEESDTDQSIEEAYISNSGSSANVQKSMAACTSSDTHLLLHPSAYNCSLPNNMRGKRSRRSHPTVLKSLRAIELSEELNHNTTKLHIGLELDTDGNTVDSGSSSEELDMANCLVMLALAGSFIEQKGGGDRLGQEVEDKEKQVGSMEVAEDLETSSDHSNTNNKQLAESAREEAASLCVPADVEANGSVRAGIAASSWVSRNKMMDAGDMPGNVLAGIAGGRFECTNCKRIFKTHQALGGHRASHKKVKGCFAKSPLEPCSSGAEAGTDGPPPGVLQLSCSTNVTSENNGTAHTRPPPCATRWPTGNLGQNVRTMTDDLIHRPAVHHDIVSTDLVMAAVLSGAAPDQAAPAKLLAAKSHQCSICLRTFSSGQALGGHKRCHWTAAPDKGSAGMITDGSSNSSSSAASASTGSMKQQLLMLDLNLPAPVEIIAAAADHYHQHHQTTNVCT